jgi:carbonic anhydrase
MPHIQSLLKGFESFKKRYYDDTELMQSLVKEGANPEVFIIHCIDPRSGAGMIFDAQPGTLFGDRVMASLVPPYDPQDTKSDFNASLTYAIAYKEVKDVIVMGHTYCGGIEALVNNIDDPAISGWMRAGEPALIRAKAKVGDTDIEALCRETERQAVTMSMRNLMTYPAVQDAVRAGKLRLQGWIFDMENAQLLGYDVNTGEFATLIHLDQEVENSDGQKQGFIDYSCGCSA